MPEEIQKEDLWALNILTASVVEQQQELQRRVAARLSYIKTLEMKTGLVFDLQTGQFKPKPAESKQKRVKEQAKKKEE